MSDVSESLRLLTKNEQPWAIRSGSSPKMSDHEIIAQVAHQKWANERIAHLLIFSQKNEHFAQQTDEQIPGPGFWQLILMQKIIVVYYFSCHIAWHWREGREIITDNVKITFEVLTRKSKKQKLLSISFSYFAKFTIFPLNY